MRNLVVSLVGVETVHRDLQLWCNVSRIQAASCYMRRTKHKVRFYDRLQLILFLFVCVFFFSCGFSYTFFIAFFTHLLPLFLDYVNILLAFHFFCYKR